MPSVVNHSEQGPIGAGGGGTGIGSSSYGGIGPLGGRIQKRAIAAATNTIANKPSVDYRRKSHAFDRHIHLHSSPHHSESSGLLRNHHRGARKLRSRSTTALNVYFDSTYGKYRASSLSDILSGIIQHQYQVYIRHHKRPYKGGTSPSKKPPVAGGSSNRRYTLATSVSFPSTAAAVHYYDQQHRLSSVSASACIGYSSRAIPSGGVLRQVSVAENESIRFGDGEGPVGGAAAATFLIGQQEASIKVGRSSSIGGASGTKKLDRRISGQQASGAIPNPRKSLESTRHWTADIAQKRLEHHFANVDNNNSGQKFFSSTLTRKEQIDRPRAVPSRLQRPHRRRRMPSSGAPAPPHHTTARTTAAVAAARVAFGLLDSSSRTSAVSRTYAHMADTSTPSAFLTGLSSQCLHTLYAGSFVVYGTNLVADWLHTYYACKGWSVTFPLRSWLVILMICCCALGGICNFLLFYLCVENALRRKWGGESFKGGCRLICQRFCNWLTDFDCFRISFLILILENAPMTFVNYWYISSCSIPRPGKTGWTFAFACCATILSIVWRALMTFLAYKNLRCIRRSNALVGGGGGGRSGSKRSTASNSAYFPLPQVPSSGSGGLNAGGGMTIGEMQHQRLEAKISGSSSASTMEELRSLASGDLTHHYDECWPVRMSCWIMYNQRDDGAETGVQASPTNATATGAAPNADGGASSPPPAANTSNFPSVRPPDNCIGYCCQAWCCVCLCALFYAGMLACCCVPCAYHYTCRRNSRVHRHKFARSCTRVCSTIFNVTIVTFTVFLVVSLLVVNLIWLSSVHVIGHNRTPPELSQICMMVRADMREVTPKLMTSIIPNTQQSSSSKSSSTNTKLKIDCKPLFDLEDRWGFWWQRRVPGPWLYQGRFKFGDSVDQLAVQTETIIGRSADDPTRIYAQFIHGTDEYCQYRVRENWTIIEDEAEMMIPLPWPYWTACERTYRVEERDGGCQKTAGSSWW